MLWIFCLVLLLQAESSMPAKIIGGSAIGGSHYMMIRNVVEELASRGHEVTLVIASAQKLKPSDKFTHKVFQVPYDEGTTIEIMTKALIEKGAASYDVFNSLLEVDRVQCECLLNNTDFLSDLKGFDLLVHDAVASCYVLVAEYLGIQRVEIIPMVPNSPLSFKNMIPMPVSYIPQAVSQSITLTDEMTFLQRVANLGMYISTAFFMSIVDVTKVNLKIKYNIKPENNFWEAAVDAELVLINADFAFEYPQPLLPGNIMVGQLSAYKKPMPLSHEFEEFVTSSGHGFIIVSFGSNVGAISKEKVDILATAFGKLKQKVVWRLKEWPASPGGHTFSKPIEEMSKQELNDCLTSVYTCTSARKQDGLYYRTS